MESKERPERIPPLDPNKVHYSNKYYDNHYEYRHVRIPKEFSKYVPRTHLMSETEWRNLGVQQSTGWEHYMLHTPEPYVLPFRRPLPDQQPENASLADAVMESFDEENEEYLYCDCKADMVASEVIDAGSPEDDNEMSDQGAQHGHDCQ